MLSEKNIAWPDLEVVDLSKEQIGGSAIHFLRIELPGGWEKPFALVRYADAGKEQQFGLRLDRDKGVFLDHLTDRRKDEFVQSQARHLMELLLKHAPAVEEQVNYLSWPLSINLGSLSENFGNELGLRLQRLELHGGVRSRFGLIRYADNYGKEPEFGIRVDLEKEALLDRTGDERLDDSLRGILPYIVLIVRELNSYDYETVRNTLEQSQ